jgi:hypothetical protein
MGRVPAYCYVLRTILVASYVEETEEAGLMGHEDVSLGQWFLKFGSFAMPSS